MIIDYSSAIMMVEYGDNNVFKSSGTSKPGTYDRNLWIYVTTTKPLEVTKDREKGSSLTMWEKGRSFC